MTGVQTCALPISLLGIPKWTVYMALAVGAGIESLLTLLTWKRRLPVDLTVDPTL